MKGVKKKMDTPVSTTIVRNVILPATWKPLFKEGCFPFHSQVENLSCLSTYRSGSACALTAICLFYHCHSDIGKWGCRGAVPSHMRVQLLWSTWWVPPVGFSRHLFSIPAELNIWANLWQVHFSFTQETWKLLICQAVSWGHRHQCITLLVLEALPFHFGRKCNVQIENFGADRNHAFGTVIMVERSAGGI